MEMKDFAEPKWFPMTKRGVGMVVTFLTSVLPFLNSWLESKYGVHVDASMIAVFGEVAMHIAYSAAYAIGLGLWVWGSFRPTAELTVLPKK